MKYHRNCFLIATFGLFLFQPTKVFSSGMELLRGNTSLSFGVYQKFKVAVDTVDTYQLGFEDGRLYHKKRTLPFIAGVLSPTTRLVGWTSVLVLALSNPIPSKGKFTFTKSRNTKYFEDPDFLKGYKKGAKRGQWGSFLVGNLTFIGIGFGLLVLLFSATS